MKRDHRQSDVSLNDPPIPEPVATSAHVLIAPVTEIPPLNRPEPTRYGDWEKQGRCIDF